MRVTRLRSLNLVLMAVWGGLALLTIVRDFRVPAAVTIGLCAIALYILCSDIVVRLAKRVNA